MKIDWKKLINLIIAIVFRIQLFSYIKYTYFISKYHSDGKCWLTSLDRYMIKKHNVRNEQTTNLANPRFDNITNLNCKLWSVLKDCGLSLVRENNENTVLFTCVWKYVC